MGENARGVTTVKLRVDEIARLPKADTVVEGVRLAIAIASERRSADAAQAALAQRLDALAAGVGDVRRLVEALDARARPTLEALAACETGPRVARIETFHVLQMEAFARFLEHFCAAQATLQGLAIAAETRGDIASAEVAARVEALQEKHLKRLFDVVDLQAQQMAEAVATPGSASALILARSAAPPPAAAAGGA